MCRPVAAREAQPAGVKVAAGVAILGGLGALVALIAVAVIK
ncbi:hypothetical protein ACIQCF_30680 [Streptomyces sp. NPDC088353]